MAKSPVAGSAKTRLCPPATPAQAARVAAAALLDTLAAVTAVDATPIVALAGDLRAAVHRRRIEAALAACVVIAQHGDGLGERLAHAHAEAAGRGGPVLQIGTDTPQVTAPLLRTAMARLAGADAVLGMAADGGWWALGLHEPAPAGTLWTVPMSCADTGVRTLAALRGLGLRVEALPVLRDVDTMADAVVVATATPGTRFAAAVAALTYREPPRRPVCGL